MAKKYVSSSPYVYSTNPNFDGFEDRPGSGEATLPAAQMIKIKLETKHRAGKAVTIIQNFSGNLEQIESLGKQLKSYCGTGGSVKDGEIIVQGDNREKILQWFLKKGYLEAVKI